MHQFFNSWQLYHKTIWFIYQAKLVILIVAVFSLLWLKAVLFFAVLMCVDNLGTSCFPRGKHHQAGNEQFVNKDFSKIISTKKINFSLSKVLVHLPIIVNDYENNTWFYFNEEKLLFTYVKLFCDAVNSVQSKVGGESYSLDYYIVLFKNKKNILNSFQFNDSQFCHVCHVCKRL